MNKVLKKTLIIAGSLLVIGFIGFQGLMMYTKSHSPKETVELKTQDVEIKITYCRPYKKERKIFGELVPYGKVWRTGANEATVLLTSRNLMISGDVLPTGKYSVWTIPDKDSWRLIFNSETGQWGVKGPSMEDNRDPANDILTTSAAVTYLDEPVEQFTITLEEDVDTKIVFTWDNVKVAFPFRF